MEGVERFVDTEKIIVTTKTTVKTIVKHHLVNRFIRFYVNICYKDFIHQLRINESVITV
jgi:hypothetical protein